MPETWVYDQSTQADYAEPLKTEQPRCEQCGAFLRWTPDGIEQNVVYPSGEFERFVLTSTCRRCGHIQEES